MDTPDKRVVLFDDDRGNKRVAYCCDYADMSHESQAAVRAVAAAAYRRVGALIKKRAPTRWTPAAEHVLLTFAAEGHTGAAIARRLGMTRSAVCG